MSPWLRSMQPFTSKAKKESALFLSLSFTVCLATCPRSIPISNPGELITAVELPPAKFAKNFYYLKVRDRNSYAFALVSVAAGLEMDGEMIKSAGFAIGGVAHKPWRSSEAERSLAGKRPDPESFAKAAEIALAGAHGYEDNTFKIELAEQSVVRALTLAAKGAQA